MVCLSANGRRNGRKFVRQTIGFKIVYKIIKLDKAFNWSPSIHIWPYQCPYFRILFRMVLLEPLGFDKNRHKYAEKASKASRSIHPRDKIDLIFVIAILSSWDIIIRYWNDVEFAILLYFYILFQTN